MVNQLVQWDINETTGVKYQYLPERDILLDSIFLQKFHPDENKKKIEQIKKRRYY